MILIELYLSFSSEQVPKSRQKSKQSLKNVAKLHKIYNIHNKTTQKKRKTFTLYKYTYFSHTKIYCLVLNKVDYFCRWYGVKLTRG